MAIIDVSLKKNKPIIWLYIIPHDTFIFDVSQWSSLVTWMCLDTKTHILYVCLFSLKHKNFSYHWKNSGKKHLIWNSFPHADYNLLFLFYFLIQVPAKVALSNRTITSSCVGFCFLLNVVAVTISAALRKYFIWECAKVCFTQSTISSNVF